MVAALGRVFGMAHLELAEEVVQEAMLQALRQWPFRGGPKEPAAWLRQTARNKALDAVRRQAAFRRKQEEIEERLRDETASEVQPFDEIADDQLAMMFACCHPVLAAESRVALTLKAVCGFGVAEIARAFLQPEATIAQRLVRAKNRLREAGVELTLPPPAEQAERLDSVLAVIYLLFNEGYTAHAGEDLVRRDLCDEALRLGWLLAERPDTGGPTTQALLALMMLQASRFDTRVDSEGVLLRLADQDRSKWDQRLIFAGLRRLERASAGPILSEYHLQAGIAAVHAVAASWDQTDWRHLLGVYDLLRQVAPSPVVELNRAVVVAMVDGPDAGLNAMEVIRRDPLMGRYPLMHATAADFLLQLGRHADAADALRSALAAPCSEPERRFLLRRLRECGEE